MSATDAKRSLPAELFDRIAATLGFVVLSPLVLLLSLLVKLESPGPALFVQKRKGEGKMMGKGFGGGFS